MNLELLEEIHILKDEGLSESDISSKIGISKQSLLLMLRIEFVMLKKQEKLIEENKILNDEILKYQSDINSFIYDLQQKKDEIEKLKNTDFLELQSEFENEISYLMQELDHERKSCIKFQRYANKYNNLPSLIKKLF